MNDIKYGLVLSGGGVGGIAHIGVIKALEEHGIRPSIISGASAGAIVGAFYAAGYSTNEILEFFQTTSLFSIKNYAVRKAGFVDTNKFYNIFKQYFPEDSFEALKKKLYISTTNIISGKTKFFHEGLLIHPLLASAAVPGVFSPMIIENELYADGGITNNFPTEPLMTDCDKIIGVQVHPLKKIKVEDL
jgi:NTE family protein